MALSFVACVGAGATPATAGGVSLDSVTPTRQRAYDMIVLRGSGFGAYVPGVSRVLFTGGSVTIEANTPYVWRDDFIRVRVPSGQRIDSMNVPIPKTPLDVSVEGTGGASNDRSFQVVIASSSELEFEQRTSISGNRDVSTFLGDPNLNLARTKDAEIADVNADGHPDLMDNNSNNVNNRTHAVLRLNDGKGSFDAFGLEPADENDGGEYLTTILPGGDYMDNATTYDADFVDLNNDGYPEYVQTAARGGAFSRLRVLVNNYQGVPGRFLEDTAGWGAEGPLPGCPDDIAHGDIDNDGFVDVATALRTIFQECGDPPGTALIYRNDAGATFVTPPIVLPGPSGESAHDVFFLDANRDGYKDVILVMETGTTCRLFLNDGKPAPSFTIGPPINYVAFSGDAGDLNGDGLDDFTLCRSGTAAVFFNDPDNPGNFTQVNLPNPTSTLYDMELGDVNLDGLLDIVGSAITQTANDTVRIWINDGDETFTNVTSPGAGVLLPGIAGYQRLSGDLVDFDGDGDLDLYIVGADGQDVGDGQGFGRVPNQFFENLLLDCVPDLDGSGAVDFADILEILADWGVVDPCPPFIPEDLDHDCQVGFSDILVVLAAWGPCP